MEILNLFSALTVSSRCRCGTVSITIGDGGNIEGASTGFADDPGVLFPVASKNLYHML